MEERRIDDVSCDKEGISKRTRVIWGLDGAVLLRERLS